MYFNTTPTSHVNEYLRNTGNSLKTPFRYLHTKGCIPTVWLSIVMNVDKADLAVLIML